MIPQTLKEVMTQVMKHGYEIYIVGGAVRDTYMNRPIHDWDLATNALPHIIQGMFAKTIDIGIKFGTVQVHYGQDHYEVTTYRKDSLKSDGRKPDFVLYTDDLKEDLARRDFSLNAMVMDIEGHIFDYFKGIDSIKSKKLQTVGQAKQRFTEDYLRVYRYIRLTQQLNFERNPLIDKAITSMDINTTISFERLQAEFNKILMTPQPSKAIRHLKDLGLLDHILPGIEATYGFDQHSQYHHLNVFDHTMLVLDQTPLDLNLRLAGLLHDIGKPPTFQIAAGEGHFYGHDKVSGQMARQVLKRLKYPNHLLECVDTLILSHMRQLDIENTASIKKFIRKIGPDRIGMWLDLRKADILGCKTQDSLSDLAALKARIEIILEEVPPRSVNDLDISGHDLMALGHRGPMIGKIKTDLLEEVDHTPGLNIKSKLIDYVKNNY